MNPKDIRRKILDLVMETKDGHLGGAFSCVEILTTLYDKVLDERDVFIMSKGHACYALYVILREKGYNPTISGHPDIEVKEGISCTTGSLGHGLPMAVGMAMAKKMKDEPGKIYVLLSDGECQEGTTWESLLIASHHNLDNLIVIVDRNKIQSLGTTYSILALDSLEEKIDAFRCRHITIDGHNSDEIYKSLSMYIGLGCVKVVVANTTKGKGVSFMENDPKWHTRIPTKDELTIAYGELE